MAESTLSRGFDELVVIVSDYLGLGRTYANLSTDNQNRVDEIVNAGLRQFYFPPPMPGPEGQPQPPHKWSFLQVTDSSTVTCVVGQEAYPLPDNYGGGLEYLAYPDNSGNKLIRVISLQEFLAIGANTTGNGTVLYAAVRHKTSPATNTGQRWEVLLNPKPDTTEALTIEYQVLPDDIDTTNEEHWGGMAHSETVVASCLAIAEERLADERGFYAQKFQERLAASIALDKIEWGKRKARAHPQTSPTTLATTYPDLQREVGRYMGYTPDPIAWSHDQTEEVDGLIHDGVRRFYYPPIVEQQQEQESLAELRRHQWSFLRENGSISATLNDLTYDCPSDFGGVISDMWYSAGAAQRPIRIIDEVKLQSLRGMDDTNGKPRYAAVKPKSAFAATATQAYAMILYPKPDASYTISFTYNVIPGRLTTTNLHPRGGAMYGETIMASCLAEAELRKTGERGAREQHFLALLKSSIELDQKSAAVTSDTAIVAETASTQSAVYTDLVRDVGAYFGFGRDSQLFSQSELYLCDDIVQRGLRQFYNPPMLPGQMVAHKWRFLHPTTTLSTVADDYDYDLPSGFSSMKGSFTYDPSEYFADITEIGEMDIRSMRSAGTNTGKPVFFAIRTKTYTGAVDPLYEAIFYPTPDAVYTLSYTYNLIAPRITTTNLFPIGGNVHADTIRKSVMACAEAEKGLGQRMWEIAFKEALAASISRDGQNAPEYFGQNLDWSTIRYGLVGG